MKRACPCLAGAVALALALVVANVPSPARAGPNPLNDPLERDHSSPYAHSAIGAVVDANRGKVPATGEELVRILATLGNFVQLPVTFSSVALDSGLTHPRVVIAMRPSSHPVRQPWGGRGDPPEFLNKTEPNHTQLEGRLFLAANMEADAQGRSRVRTVEFISWNTRKRKFDFGVIEGMHTSAPELKVLDGVRCFSCHKNRGPILGDSPWSNTMHNTLVWNTASEMIPGARSKESQPVLDGMRLFDPQASAVDAAVRQGAELLRDRAVFKRLPATDEGRKALALLLCAALKRGPLAKHDLDSCKELNTMALNPFIRASHVTRQATVPDVLRDVNLTVPVTRALTSFEASEVSSAIRKIDQSRGTGFTLPPAYAPSNPAAFVRTGPKPVKQPSDAVGAAILARTIGLTEPDRAFLADVLDETAERLDDSTLCPADVANLIFNGPLFADLMRTGDLPDRDDFKDRFVAGASALLKDRKRDDYFAATRDSYTSAPKFDPGAKSEDEAPVLPSHACLGCHDVRTAGKQTFNPIPQLAFDPFDTRARAEWLKTADRKRKTEVLSRMLKRLGTDKDMPPEDSTEHELYRKKDPAALTAVKSWLESELKKAK